MDEKEKSIHAGHRQKVKDAYLARRFSGEPDHRLLEMLLFFGIPYRDTNEIAHLLLERFGSFADVLRATPEQLKQVKGMTMNASILVSMILPLYQRYEECLVEKRPILNNTEAIVQFMRPKYIGVRNERAYALCLDENARLITLQELSEGDPHNTVLNLRRLASAVLESDISHVVLVHNHPNEIVVPSSEDVHTTKLTRFMLHMLQVELDDHIIISAKDSYSMLNSGRFTSLFYGCDEAE